MQKKENTEKKQNLQTDYNGRPITPGEVLVPMNRGKLFIDENVTNHDNVKTVGVQGVNTTVVYSAVPKEWEREAKSQLNLETNERLGHYDVPNSTSMDAVADKHDLALASSASAEDIVMVKEDIRSGLKLMKKLVMKAPKLGYAFLLTLEGIQGTEFYDRMRLSRTAANRLRQMADKVIKDGIANFDIDNFTSYRSKLDETYKAEALEILDLLMTEFL